MKIFYLNRLEDESGVSGTGRVAQGFIFDNGKVALTWLSEHPSVTIYDNIGEVHAIHSHDGKTEVEMMPDYKRAFGELLRRAFRCYQTNPRKHNPENPRMQYSTLHHKR